MPEIAEVARVTHFLRQHLVGKKIGRVWAPDDSNVFGKAGTSGPALEAALAGKTVVDAGRQGKYFWLLLDSPPHPVMHLGMTGWVHIRGAQTPYNRYAERAKGDADAWPPSHWKFHLRTDPGNADAEAEAAGAEAKAGAVEVAFTDPRRFGRVRLVDCPGADIRRRSPLVENGPDPVIDRDVFTEDFLRQKMRARHVPVKALLLDQATVSGIGNWVGDEIMYQARLHPEQYCDDFSDADIGTLYSAVRYVCDTAVEKLGDSDRFPEDWLFKHRWGKGKKDAATTLPNGEKISFITVGGRTSCIVPSRQKKTGRVAADVRDSPPPGEGEESRFFASKKAGKGRKVKAGAEAKAEAEEFAEQEGEQEGGRPKKRTRTVRATPAKEAKQEKPAINGTGGKSRKRKQPEKESEPPPPVSGRRRSGRLNKAAS
ncbi:formamidopyrimidine-DNA glycosylase [Xylariaceae sp. FL0804]|nr:formamidopyrimidine-DNA glycosylase [Xylariaceae sp. FL0804]